MINTHVNDTPELAWDLMDVTEEPLTLILPQGKNLAEGVTAKDGSVAIRLTKDVFCKKLVQRFGKPIVSTSANITGSPTASTFSDIDESIKTKVDYCVDGRLDRGSKKSSSLIRIDHSGNIEILRK